MYTLGRWLLPGKTGGEIATLQPVTKVASEFWTSEFEVAAQWFRQVDDGNRMRDHSPSRAGVLKKKMPGPKKAPKKRAAK